MINDYYPFLPAVENTQFFFFSEGKEGDIFKIILFSLNEDGCWNLGFGDIKGEEIDDSIMSNNHDAAKVMRTVAKAVLIFLETYPDKIVFIEPVDEKRKRFYNAIFQRYFKEIEPFFEILGLIDKQSEIYSSLKIYDFFKLKLKKK